MLGPTVPLDSRRLAVKSRVVFRMTLLFTPLFGVSIIMVHLDVIYRRFVQLKVGVCVKCQRIAGGLNADTAPEVKRQKFTQPLGLEYFI